MRPGFTKVSNLFTEEDWLKKMTYSQLKVYLTILSYQKDGKTKMTARRLAAECFCSRRQVMRSLKALNELGLTAKQDGFQKVAIPENGWQKLNNEILSLLKVLSYTSFAMLFILILKEFNGKSKLSMKQFCDLTGFNKRKYSSAVKLLQEAGLILKLETSAFELCLESADLKAAILKLEKPMKTLEIKKTKVPLVSHVSAPSVTRPVLESAPSVTPIYEDPLRLLKDCQQAGFSETRTEAERLAKIEDQEATAASQQTELHLPDQDAVARQETTDLPELEEASLQGQNVTYVTEDLQATEDSLELYIDHLPDQDAVARQYESFQSFIFQHLSDKSSSAVQLYAKSYRLQEAKKVRKQIRLPELA